MVATVVNVKGGIRFPGAQVSDHGVEDGQELVHTGNQSDQKSAKKIIVSVKGGEHVTRTMIADLKNSVEREGAQMGLFVTLAEPTEPMIKEAVSAGYYDSPLEKSFPKIQLLTISGLLSGSQSPQYPDLSRSGLSFKKPKTEETGE